MRLIIAVVLIFTISSNAVSGQETLKVSPADVVRTALENNIDIKIEAQNKEKAQYDVTKSKSIFDTSLFASVNLDRSITPQASAFADPEIGRIQSQSLSIGLDKKFPAGSSYKLDFTTRKRNTNSNFSGLDPEYASGLSLAFSHPLLKGAGENYNKKDIYISMNNEIISGYNFKNIVIKVVSQAKNLFWDLMFATENMKVKEESLELAMEFKKEVQLKKDAGLLAPIELVAADAEVASRMEDVIIAKNDLLDIEDNLKKLLGIKNTKLLLDTQKPYLPDESESTMDVEHYITVALKKRPDYEAEKIALENSKILVAFYNNQVYPSVDLEASLNLNGISGNAIPVSIGGSTKTTSFAGSYAESLDTLKDGRFYSWNAGVMFSIPISNKSAKATLAQSRLDVEKALYKLKNLEDQIQLDVSKAARKVEANLQRIQATRLSRKLAAEKLAAEKSRFAVGLSTSFRLLEFQRDLAAEKSKEIKAFSDYMKARIALNEATGDTIDKNAIRLID